MRGLLGWLCIISVVTTTPEYRAALWWCARFPQGRCTIVVGDAHHAARTEHTLHLAQGAQRLAEMLHQCLREHGIEAGVRVWELVDRGGLEADIRNTALDCHDASAAYLGRLDVDADDLAGRDRHGQVDGDQPGPQPQSSTRMPGRR